MTNISSRAAHGLLALALLTAACADDDPFRPLDRAAPQFAYGDEIVVTNTNDNGLGSLRWAIGHATNFENVVFDPSLAGRTIVLDSQLVVAYPIEIIGPAGKGITIDGAGKTRIFYIPNGGNTTLRNMTLANGNSGAEEGGAIWSKQSVGIVNSTLTGNVAPNGAAVAGYNVALFNSTASGNTATAGAVVKAESHLQLNNATVAFNSGAGAAAFVLRPTNAVISNHGPAPNCGPIGYSIVHSGQNISDDDTCGGPTKLIIANPQLAPLADNGGPSRTHALQAGSPAINAGSSCTFPVDQRYVPRDSTCDLGAYEFIDFTTIEVTIDAGPTINPFTKVAMLTGTVRCSRDESFDLALQLSQTRRVKNGTEVVDAVGMVAVSCTTTPSAWGVALTPATGEFTIGSADAKAQTVNVPGWATPVTKTAPVRLYMGHR